jgi:hypothetical protein
MLNSLTRHFNETVFRGPDNEGGGGDGETVTNDLGGDAGGADDSGGGVADGEVGQGDEKLTVREQLKKAIAETSEPPAKSKKEKSGRFGDRPVPGQTAAKADDTAPLAPPPAPAAISAPASLPKEAAAEWEKTPPAIQAAFVKREQDMEKGVAELKQRYNLIDQAIAPHNDALRQMNATPADAVNRMFLWFKALAGRPAESFPALAQSMGIDWKRLTSPQAAPADQAAAQGTGSGTAPEIPDPVRQYVGSLESQVRQLSDVVQQIYGRFGNVEQNLNSQNMARTQENLNFWSKDKPHFNDVRMDMAKLIETGVIPLKDGQVDLDTAYERAIYFNPEVRVKVLAEQQQANQAVQQKSQDAATTAQQTQVTKARKAGVSLPASTTPGAANGEFTRKKPGEKLSVRDSLKASIAQLRDQ